MKLEVGMYYRYKGIIGKYHKPELGQPFFTNQHKYGWSEIANGGKFSHNIIDLIEVGDYVNGYKVDFVQNNEIVYNHNHPRQLNMFAKDIKSIVTKEQFLSMSYKVGE